MLQLSMSNPTDSIPCVVLGNSQWDCRLPKVSQWLVEKFTSESNKPLQGNIHILLFFLDFCRNKKNCVVDPSSYIVKSYGKLVVTEI